MAIYYINESECNGCGCCAGVCPHNAIVLCGTFAYIDQYHCTDCGYCSSACHAIY